MKGKLNMRKILILTDSTSDLSKEEYARLNVKVAPLSVLLNDKTYTDGVDINSDIIYGEVAKGAALPKTSAVSPTAFADIFKEYIDEDYDIFYVGIGSLASATFAAATMAKSEFPDDRIALVDSSALSTGAGLLVLKACKLRDEGKNLQEIAEAIQKLAPHVSTQFSVHTMEYLYKGGRCSGLKYVLGKLLSIHPVIKMTDGKLDVFATPRGKYTRSIDILLKMLDNDLPNIDMDRIFVTHSNADPKYVDYIYNELLKRLPKEMISITHTGAVVTSHCGPNTIGLLWISGKKQIKNNRKTKAKKD